MFGNEGLWVGMYSSAPASLGYTQSLRKLFCQRFPAFPVSTRALLPPLSKKEPKEKNKRAPPTFPLFSDPGVGQPRGCPYTRPAAFSANLPKT